MNLFVLAMVVITMSANTDYTIGSYRGAVIDKKPIQTVKRHCYSSRLIVCLCYLYAHGRPKLSIRAPLRSQSCREHGSCRDHCTNCSPTAYAQQPLVAGAQS